MSNISYQPAWHSRQRAIAGFLGLLSIILFLVSLTQDSFYIDRQGGPEAYAPGWFLLLFGWSPVIRGVVPWPWLANPAVALTWPLMCFRGGRIVGLLLATLALGLALCFLGLEKFPTDANGGHLRITGYGLGYWLWVTSIGMALLCCIVGLSLDIASHKMWAL